MASIPQITRDRLASSAVGTPGVDTSGQKIEDSLASGAGQVGQAVGEYAVQRQSQLDQAEANRLILNNNMAAVDTMEQAKTTFAQNPEKAGPALQEQLQTNLTNTQAQSSNPRVALKVGLGNPYFDSKMALDMQQWAVEQRKNIETSSLQNQGMGILDQTTKYVDGSHSLDDNMNQVLLASHNLGQLIAGAHSVIGSERAQALSNNMMPSLATKTAYKIMETNGAQATQFLNDPNIRPIFDNDPKQYETISNKAQEQTQLQTKESFVDNRVNIFNLLKDNGSAFATTNIIGWTARKDMDLSLALQKVADSKSNYTPDAQDEQEQQKMLSNLVKQGDGKSVSDSIVNYLKDKGDKLKPNELASLMQLGLDLHGNVPKTEASVFNQNSITSDHISGVKSLVDIGDKVGINSFPMVQRYQNYTKAGLNATGAVSQALKDQQAVANPGIALSDKPANTIVSKGEVQRYFISREDDMTKFPFMYDPNTKAIIPNREYRAKRD